MNFFRSVMAFDLMRRVHKVCGVGTTRTSLIVKSKLFFDVKGCCRKFNFVWPNANIL